MKDIGSVRNRAAAGESSTVEALTLKDIRFIQGDFLDVAILTGDAAVAAAVVTASSSAPSSSSALGSNDHHVKRRGAMASDRYDRGPDRRGMASDRYRNGGRGGGRPY